MTCADHVAGMIASSMIHHSEWNVAITAFAAKVHDFNVRGQRVQIEHPGWVHEAKFCPECGSPVSRDGLLTFSDALTACEENDVTL